MAKKKSKSVRYEKKWDEYIRDGGLESWQRLCHDLGLQGDFPSKRQCRKAMTGIWINICDFLNAVDKQTMHRFGSEGELSHYTTMTGHIFPKRKVKEVPNGSPLKLLMANILYPRRGGKKPKKNNTSASCARIEYVDDDTGLGADMLNLNRILAGLTVAA